ncbi:MAG: multicopper oxidase domain-containing protein [Burkholderiaceae bacterium]
MIANPFRKLLLPLAVASTLGIATSAGAAVFVQCPGDTNGDAKWTLTELKPPNTACMHLTAGDGFITMADGRSLYIFGFDDVTGQLPSTIGLDVLPAKFAAPTITLKQNENFYLTLTNVGMAIRPDLFDPHTVHFHGFPEQPPVFDGMPEGSFGVNMGSSVTYYYKLNDPGTYMYHCHMEATEHMQMGMLGNLYVTPAQDGSSHFYDGKTYTQFVFNDAAAPAGGGAGSTGYDVAYPLQFGSMDHNFHDASEGVQPLPFADMRDTYAMINGRGYPDTVNPNPLDPPAAKVDYLAPAVASSSQEVSSLITATHGDRILLRLSNLNVTNYYTVTAQGLPMKVVGAGARQLKGPDGTLLYYDTSSVTLGGGESVEVMIDTRQVSPGTYFLYTTNLNFLSNFEQDNGGMMTEIVIN